MGGFRENLLLIFLFQLVLGLWRQDWGTREKMKKPFSLCIPFTSWAVVLIICASEHYGMNKGIENTSPWCMLKEGDIWCEKFIASFLTCAPHWRKHTKVNSYYAPSIFFLLTVIYVTCFKIRFLSLLKTTRQYLGSCHFPSKRAFHREVKAKAWIRGLRRHLFG